MHGVFPLKKPSTSTRCPWIRNPLGQCSFGRQPRGLCRRCHTSGFLFHNRCRSLPRDILLRLLLGSFQLSAFPPTHRLFLDKTPRRAGRDQTTTPTDTIDSIWYHAPTTTPHCIIVNQKRSPHHSMDVVNFSLAEMKMFKRLRSAQDASLFHSMLFSLRRLGRQHPISIEGALFGRHVLRQVLV